MFAFCGKNMSLLDSNTYTIVDTFPKESVEDWEFTDFSWSCDNKYLAVLRLFGPVEVLTVEDGKISSSQKIISSVVEAGVDSRPTSVAFMRNSSRYLAVGNKNGTVVIWDVKANIVKKTLTPDGIQGEVEFLDSNMFGSHIATGGASGNILVYEYSSPSKKKYQIPRSTRVTALRYQSTAHSSTVGAGSAEGHVAFWNTITGAEVGFIVGAHEDAIADLSFSPVNSKLAATVSRKGQLSFHEFAQRRSLVTCETGETLTSIDLCGDDVMAIVGTASGRLLGYDIRCLSYPMTTKDFLAPIKKLRYAQATTAANSSMGSASPRPALGVSTAGVSTPRGATDSPVKSTRLNIFSPLRSESYSSNSTYSGCSPSYAAPNLSSPLSPLVSHPYETPDKPCHDLGLAPTKADFAGAESTPLPLRPKCPTESPKTLPDGYCFGIFSPLRSESCLDSSGSTYYGSSTSFAELDRSLQACKLEATANGTANDANGNRSALTVPSGRGVGALSKAEDELSIGNTSTPLHDVSRNLIPFTDPKTKDEISPICQVATSEADIFASTTLPNVSAKSMHNGNIVDVAAEADSFSASSTSQNVSAPTFLNHNIVNESTAVEEGTVSDNDDRRVLGEESSGLIGEWDSDLSLSSCDEEFHSQRDEDADQDAVPSVQELNGAAGNNQVLVQHLQIIVENLNRLFAENAEIRERLTRLEALPR